MNNLFKNISTLTRFKHNVNICSSLQIHAYDTQLHKRQFKLPIMIYTYILFIYLYDCEIN